MIDIKKRKKGDIYAWGSNNLGQLGNGNVGGKNWKPTIITGTKKKWVFIDSSYNFSIALTKGGSVISWGEGENGQLGNGEKKNSSLPIKITSIKKGSCFAATGLHHALILKNNTLFSWGLGDNGRLGHGNEQSYTIPTPIKDSSLNGKKITSFDTGAEHCALVANGSVYTWGKGENGRLGHGNEKDMNSPTLVEALEGKEPIEVFCGTDWTTVLTKNGNVYSFGYGANGRLGIGNDFEKNTPQLIETFCDKKIKQIACGHDHSLALTEDGKVWSWGYGGNGRLGHGDENDEKKPKEVGSLHEIVFISSGGYHSAAINAKGELYTWGWNYYGQLGFESTNDHPIPTLVESFKGKKVLYVTCGEKHTLAIVQ